MIIGSRACTRPELSSPIGGATTTRTGRIARLVIAPRPNSPRCIELRDARRERKSASLSTRTLLTRQRHYYWGQVILPQLIILCRFSPGQRFICVEGGY